jgi:hypothetical protein
VLQQTPSVQNPDAHSESFEHWAARGLGPQLPLTQRTPETQSASDRQVTTQARVEGSQSNGAQIVAGPGLQRPFPSHTLTSTTDATSHAPGLQTAPAMWLRQAPFPSQVPSSPHVETSAAGQSLASRGAPPAGTKLHSPDDPWTSHALQLSVQEVLQQTPSTQKPLWQSAAQPQAAPFILVPLPPSLEHAAPSIFPSMWPPSFGLPDDPHPAAASPIAATNSVATSARGPADELPPRAPRTWDASGR